MTSSILSIESCCSIRYEPDLWVNRSTVDVDPEVEVVGGCYTCPTNFTNLLARYYRVPDIDGCRTSDHVGVEGDNPAQVGVGDFHGCSETSAVLRHRDDRSIEYGANG